MLSLNPKLAGVSVKLMSSFVVTVALVPAGAEFTEFTVRLTELGD